MAVLELTPGGYMIHSSCYIANTPGVEVNSKVGGLKGFFSGAGAFGLQATGQGQVLIGAFGGIQELACDGNMVIDTGHLVAWDSALTYKVGKSGSGWIASFLSGEGLVCHFQGQGRIWIQSRNAPSYGETVGKMLQARD
jgi:uncharacterized protein (TIGR00266 family)